MHHEHPTADSQLHKRQDGFQQNYFASRWLQLPLYLGLIIAHDYNMAMKSLYFNDRFATIDSNAVMLAVLNLIDVVMIANLLVMVTVGG